MGQPKMILPWGESTVIGTVVSSLLLTDVHPIVVVTGAAEMLVKLALTSYPVRFVHNPAYISGEMLSSLQRGLRCLPAACVAVLVVLGDQPQIEVETLRLLLTAHMNSSAGIIVPSYQRRRGHPWLVRGDFWQEILALSAPATLRDFLNAHDREIEYLAVDSASVLLDLDTPQDYEQQRPR